jgi:hypothetical protein
MAKKPAVAKKTVVTKKHASQWIGHPVYVVLQDGSCYAGFVTDVKNGEMFLSGARGNGKLSSSTLEDKAQISGLLGAMFGGGGGNPLNMLGLGTGQQAGGAAGGAAEAAPGGGAQAGGGFLEKMIPNIRLGLNMLQMIMPIFRFL